VTARRAFDVTAMNRHPDFLVYGMVDVYTNTPNGPAEGEASEGGGSQLELHHVRHGRAHAHLVRAVASFLGYRVGEDPSVFRVVSHAVLRVLRRSYRRL
jgi:hypothetical protein